MLSLKVAILLGAFLAIVVTIFEQKKYKKLEKELNKSLSKLERIEIPSSEECDTAIFQQVEPTHIPKYPIRRTLSIPEVNDYFDLVNLIDNWPVSPWTNPNENIYNKDFDEIEPFSSNPSKRGYNYFGKLLPV